MTTRKPRMPIRILVMNIALVVAWLPLIFIARHLIEDVIAGSPSDDLLEAAHLAVIGTLTILTVVYLFAIVLANKFATQNMEGVHRRFIRPVLTSAIVLYLIAWFGSSLLFGGGG